MSRVPFCILCDEDEYNLTTECEWNARQKSATLDFVNRNGLYFIKVLTFVVHCQKKIRGRSPHQLIAAFVAKKICINVFVNPNSMSFAVGVLKCLWIRIKFLLPCRLKCVSFNYWKIVCEFMKWFQRELQLVYFNDDCLHLHRFGLDLNLKFVNFVVVCQLLC